MTRFLFALPLLLLSCAPEKSGAADDANAKPRLALLTSLPLVFGETFSIEPAGSPTLTRLQRDYDVEAIAVADAASLQGKDMLLMAHPLAQPAEVLVELDQWVRDGGRVMLLADPKLSWPLERPLGDRLRAPPAFADTGLLIHWGLLLEGPITDGPTDAEVDGLAFRTSSPGRLRIEGGDCVLAGDGLVARCSIGKGKATIIADADLLNVPDDVGKSPNLDLISKELARLSR